LGTVFHIELEHPFMKALPGFRPSRRLLRPLGDVIYFMPPYVITEDEIRFMAEVATEGIERAAAQ
jgi:adenosylmethionine-8-amino-7-oxononanoate aminotransferase